MAKPLKDLSKAPSLGKSAKYNEADNSPSRYKFYKAEMTDNQLFQLFSFKYLLWQFCKSYQKSYQNLAI
jgi:hypothetical protein